MQRYRYFILAALFAAPVLTLVGFGMYYLWWTGLGFWVWWPVTGCFVLAYFLAWRWLKHENLLSLEEPVPDHWTDRDRQAWSLVEARAKDILNLKAEQLTNFSFFVETAESMAAELARHYHPGAKDPLGSLTIPEILAVVELAARDLRKMVDEYLPGGHLLTINDMRRFKKIADWYPTASNISWLISSVFAPFNTAIRYLAVQAGTKKPWQMLQENILVWFFTAFVHRLGSYLIEVNSGRLRVGVDRFLQLQNAKNAVGGNLAQAVEAESADSVRSVTFVLIGQTKAGKSSLINALFGEERAVTDIVASTPEVTRYQLQPPEIPQRIELLDTVGYGSSGARADQKRFTKEAARQADMIFLVVHARNPARQADLDFIQELRRYFDEQPELRKPPVLAVLTHIDLLSPSMEWAPPYNWENPERTKEHQIDQAVSALRAQLGAFLTGIVPVCTAPGKVYGVKEWLLPAVIELLDQAHAVAFLRCLKAEKDTGKIRKVLQQLLALGAGLGKILLQSPKPPK